jgi:hypothetical protein
VATLFAVACSQSAAIPFARLLDRAASWAASVQFAEEMRRAGNVPQAYVDDLLDQAAREVDLPRKLSQSDAVELKVKR